MNLTMSRNEIGGLIAGIIPFFLSVGGSSTRTVNGQVVSSSSFNLVAIAGGLIALVLGLGGLRLLSDHANGERNLHIAFAILVALLGGFQILRGIGLVTSF